MMKVRKVIKLLEEDGWRMDRQRGGHRIFRHPEKPASVTVAGRRGTDESGGYVGEHPSSGGPARMEAVSEYAVIYECGETSWGAWVPDLAGCVAVGDTSEEVAELIGEAIRLHIESLREHGDPVPPPVSSAATVAVSPA